MRCRPTVVRSSPSASTSSIYGYARCGGAVKKIVPRGKGSGGWQTTSFPNRVSFISGPKSALPSDTRGGSRMPQLGPYGSVRGALSNERPYRESQYGPGRVGATRWLPMRGSGQTRHAPSRYRPRKRAIQVRRMGGAKRYPSIASWRRGWVSQRANPILRNFLRPHERTSQDEVT